jgi:hypothetical protein
VSDLPERVSYVIAAKAQRQANERAAALKLSSGDRAVLAAVLDLTTSYSKLVDHVQPEQLARRARQSLRTVQRSLPRLADAGIIVHVAGCGAGNVTVVGVPPEGVKGDTYLSSFHDSELSPFPSAKGDKKTPERVTPTRARLSREDLPRRTTALGKEEALDPEPSRDHDQAVGEGTREPGSETDDDRLLAEVRRLHDEQEEERAAAVRGSVEKARLASERARNGSAPVCVTVADDGSLEWSEPPREGEAAVLADAQALVDAGLARWIDGEQEAPRAW